jgi:hypothetical protein
VFVIRVSSVYSRDSTSPKIRLVRGLQDSSSSSGYDPTAPNVMYHAVQYVVVGQRKGCSLG